MHTPQPIIAATGKTGEDRALRYLQARGLAAVSRNYRCKGGEIDLMMRDAAGALVLAESRARVARSMQRSGRAAASVTPVKQRRLIVAVGDFLAWQVEDVLACRLDVTAIDGARIEWMCDASDVDA